MRVLAIAPYFAPNPEVAAVRMVSLSSQLVADGHEVDVLCLSREGLLRENTPEELTASVPDGVGTLRYDIDYSTAPLVADYVNGKRFVKILPRLVDVSRYDVAIATCGPYYTLEAMPALASRGLPFVLDFRDLGAINYRPKIVKGAGKAEGAAKAAAKRAYGRLLLARERRAVDSASHVICISDIDRAAMQKAYAIPDEKLTVATNGYDEARLADVKPAPESVYGLTASVFGKFMYYDKDKALAILAALSDLRARGVDAGLAHIGKKYDWIDGAIAQAGIDPACYTNLGLMEYQRGMAQLGAADFFVVEDTSPDDVGTKIYDYIYWNKPVVAVVPPDGPLARLVRRFENGFVCETSDDVLRAVEKIAHERLDCLDPQLDRGAFSRRRQNTVIEDVLAVVAKREGGQRHDSEQGRPQAIYGSRRDDA